MRRFVVGSLLVVSVLALAPPALAQQGTAEIVGRVSDESGGILPGANILLTNEDSGVFREATSGGDGSYFASQMRPGRYRLQATLGGFRTFERRGIVLEVGKTLTLNVTMSLGHSKRPSP